MDRLTRNASRPTTTTTTTTTADPLDVGAGAQLPIMAGEAWSQPGVGKGSETSPMTGGLRLL